MQWASNKNALIKKSILIFSLEAPIVLKENIGRFHLFFCKNQNVLKCVVFVKMAQVLFHWEWIIIQGIQVVLFSSIRVCWLLMTQVRYPLVKENSRFRLKSTSEHKQMPSGATLFSFYKNNFIRTSRFKFGLKFFQKLWRT